MFLADTTFLIDLINSDEGAAKFAKTFDEKQISVYISSVTVEEYLRGIYYLFSNDEQKLREKLLLAESDLARFQVIDFDYKIAKAAAQIDADLTIKGSKIGFADILIGATAKFYNLRVITRNIKHFSRIKDLHVDIY